MDKSNEKELKEFGKFFQVKSYERLYDADKLPECITKEILVLGKSNVGKSSFINAILNYNLTKTSKQPGCTKWIGYIKLDSMNLIDIPGYGYSKVSKSRKAFWQIMIEKYIQKNRAHTAIILIDGRKGICQEDTEVASFFQNHIFIYTKTDEKNVYVPENSIKTSAKKGIGLNEVRKLLINL